MSAHNCNRTNEAGEAGFSLIELMIGMAVALVVMGLAGELISSSFNIRAREDRRSEAVADAQRALSLMSREIGNSGYSLPNGLTFSPPAGGTATVPRNGILPGYSTATDIAVVTNPNENALVNEPDEAVFYTYDATNTRIVRTNMGDNIASVVAGGISAVQLGYVDRNPATGALAAPAAAPSANTVAVNINISLLLAQVSTPGAPGYQPPTTMQLNSQVALRNAVLQTY